MQLFLLGLLMVGVSVLVSTMKSKSNCAFCIAPAFLMHIGIGLAWSAVLLKHYRLYRLFHAHSSSLLVLTISDCQLFLWVGAVALLQSVLLIIKHTVSPPHMDLIEGGMLGCAASTDPLSTDLEVVLAVLECVLMLASLALAILNRDLPAKFNETMPVVISCFTFLPALVVILLTPLGVFEEAGRTAIVTLSSVLLVAAVVSLCSLWGTLAYGVWFGPTPVNNPSLVSKSDSYAVCAASSSPLLSSPLLTCHSSIHHMCVMCVWMNGGAGAHELHARRAGQDGSVDGDGGTHSQCDRRRG